MATGGTGTGDPGPLAAVDTLAVVETAFAIVVAEARLLGFRNRRFLSVDNTAVFEREFASLRRYSPSPR